MSGYRDSGRRESSSSHSRRDEYRRRSPSPASSSGRSSESSVARGERSLPEQFGKVASDKKESDDTTVLQCMKRSFDTNPLGCLTKCIKNEKLKLKVWTRNYKEIRGICTGTVIAFDKHWNMILKDVKEVYLKPKKAKTPFLIDEKEAKDFKELPPREPKKKASSTVEPAVKMEPSSSPPEAVEPTKQASEGEGSKKSEKKKKRKKRTTIPTDRNTNLCFIRGDNIVMAAVVEVASDGEEDE